MDFRRYETIPHPTRPLSSVTLDIPSSSSFVPNRNSRTRPSSAGTGSHCRLSRPRSSIDLFRGRMDERRLSSPPSSSTTPPRRSKRSSTVRPTSFLDMSEPSRFSIPGARLLSSSSMDGIRVGKRKVDLEVKIPDGMSSSDSFGPLNMARTGSASFGRTLNTFFLRPKRRSQESGLSSPPGLFSGESAHSDSSMPPTPRSATFAPLEPAHEPDVPEEEKKAGVKEIEEVKRILKQFDYRRQQLPHHKYPKEEVPYMQSYSAVSLQNDYYTYDLLHHLTPAGSPSFHDFGDNPPREVLDLGCGEGYWAADAVSTWMAAGTVVTAYDLVNLNRPLKKALDPEIERRIMWAHGNFLRRGLPFPPRSFDFIRMANLTLAIPKHRWLHLLKEVKRMLRPGGIVEIIDDELFFPSIQPGPTPSLKHSRSMAGRCQAKADLETRCVDECAMKPSRPPSPRSSRHCLKTTSDPAAEYRQRSLTTRTVETIFQNMLESEYGVSTRPYEFLEHEMLQVFDGVIVETREVSVPKKDIFVKLDESSGPRTSDVGTRLRKSRISLESEVCTDFSRPSYVAPKAAKLLQLDAGDPRPYQPPGYIISPSTFIPCEPDALEMHALHNVHTLLSCKDALGRYIEQQRDENGEPLLTDAEFEEVIGDYEDFKRRRMNWPQDYPDLKMEEPHTSTDPSKPLLGRRDLAGRNRDSSSSISMNVPATKDAVIPVRRIRVFVGHKSNPKAMHR